MGYGSTVAVEEAEEVYREACAKLIEEGAAKLVGARDMTRRAAIEAEAEALRQQFEAENDVTGVLETMLNPPVPSKPIPEAQARAIGRELRDVADDAAQTL